MYHSVLNHLEAIIMANKEVQDLITVSRLILILTVRLLTTLTKKSGYLEHTDNLSFSAFSCCSGTT